MAKKKASKSEKKDDENRIDLVKENHELAARVATLEAENKELHNALQAQSGMVAQTMYGEQPIIVEEVAAIIPLLKDMNGNLMDEHNFTHQMAQSVGMAIKGVKMIREALAMQEEDSPNDPDAEEELEG